MAQYYILDKCLGRCVLLCLVDYYEDISTPPERLNMKIVVLLMMLMIQSRNQQKEREMSTNLYFYLNILSLLWGSTMFSQEKTQ